jgi:hypothetical protein
MRMPTGITLQRRIPSGTAEAQGWALSFLGTPVLARVGLLFFFLLLFN